MRDKFWRKTCLTVVPATLSCFLLAGCHSGEKTEEPVVAVQAVTVQKSDISQVVTTEAILFPVAQAVITPKINAPVKKFYITRAQKVHKGQLLAELENRDLSAESLRLTTLRYQAGEATVLEVVDAQNTLTQAQGAYHDGVVRYRAALANLQTLTGTM